eukprot:CAMPEP_0116836124 /NCGR_PEP_ID=MMETSP0418-20121206/7919_1 /TAXON_ID=1158023 /ORGANISM="Astrosyne radiata, Strain 13vi08-1A" /LENGTH=366 /DNA_ID=CAMNT_0004465853 /DNA_START=72 /DNA_END=1172 /DNA_ORIENTATION=+
MATLRFVLVGLFVLSNVDAFLSTTSTTKCSFVTHQKQVTKSTTQLMDTEGDLIDVESRRKIEALISGGNDACDVDQAERAIGMPWKSSIDESLPKDSLVYMPFWEWQMDFMKQNLSNLRVQSCTSEDGTDFAYNENTKRKARIVNMCFSSDEYRKIRLTYYDAGGSTQVFNSVWYPNPKYNLPVLGLDLLAFNQKKYLAIVDFQPLHDKEDMHAAKYESILKPIKEKYDALKGRMSAKFYDETKFFSPQMLFSRFEDEGVIADELYPAFQEYVKAHVDMLKSTCPDTDAMQMVLDRQQAYDVYSADRDPATGFFAAMFGKDWADSFVYDFLFSLSEKKEGRERAMPVMGGPPKQRQAPAAAVAKEA